MQVPDARLDAIIDISVEASDFRRCDVVAESDSIGYILEMIDEQNVSQSTKSAVEKVLRDQLGPVGFTGANIITIETETAIRSWWSM